MEAGVLFASALASQEANQDPMDLAFLAAAKERHILANAQGVAQSSAPPLSGDDLPHHRGELALRTSGRG